MFKKTSQFLAFILLALSFLSAAEAEVISWWRFETDNDSTTNGLDTPNDVATEPAINSSNATLGTSAPDLFDTIVPGANVPNTASVLAQNNGGTNDGIFGTAAYSSTLDVNSITVEFWVRTTENTAGFIARTTNNDDAAEGATIDDGFSITDPNNVQVSFYTSKTSGGNRIRTDLSSNITVNDGEWHYIAFRYNENTTQADLTVDDTTVSTTVSSTEVRYLWWGNGNPQPEVMVGYQLDGNPNNNTGTLDEIRFTDFALDDKDLLITPVPEPSTILAGLILTGFIGFDLRRRLKKNC